VIKVIKTPRGPRITWSRTDAWAMAKIVGAEDAADRRAPLVDSILKLASRSRTLRLGRSAREQLADAERERRAAGLLVALDAAAPGSRQEERFFAHQRADLFFMQQMEREAYLIAHRVGAGKTLEAIGIAQTELQPDARNLVVTLNSAKLQWADELARWREYDRIPIKVLSGTIAQQIETITSHRRGWLVAHWESLVHARLGYLSDPWGTVVLDEAHEMQNHQAQRSLTAFKLRAALRLALTAHPFANDPSELFSILKFLYPTIYTSYWRFFHTHVKAVPKEFGGFEVEGVRRPKLLRWELAPFTLRRVHIKGMPQIQRRRRYAELTTRGRREYERIQRQFFAALEVELEDAGGQPLEKILVIPSVLARLTRLRQYLVDPGLLGAAERSVKYPIVKELLRATDRPPIIFTSFEQAARRLQKFLGAKRMPIIAGFVPTWKRRLIQQEWIKGKYDAVIVVTKAGGAALNLGGRGYVIFLDLPWNARALEQAEGRVDRPEEGTGRIVQTVADRIIVQDSYEERIEAKITQKYDMFKQVFSVSQLKELFA
jgi:SNF2 family DNA or RNA helicase